MIRILNSKIPLLGALFVAASLATSASASSTFIKFSIDMSTMVGNGFTPGTDSIEAHGSFNGWGALTLVLDGTTATVYTNTAEDTTDANGGKVEYKYVINGSNYENPATYGHNRGAHLPATSGASLVLPTVFFGDNGTLATSNVKFQVDMAQQVALGVFTPGTSAVEVQGKFNGWASGSVLNWDPSQVRVNQYGLSSTNVYTNTFSVSGSPGGADQFKFVIQSGNYESVGDVNNYVSNDGDHNRYFSDTAQTIPVYFFSDNPYAPIVSNITFSVDMSVVALTDTNFNPASVTVNGDLMGWGGVPMTNNPTAANTNIYTVNQPYFAGVGSGVNYQFRYTLLSSPATTIYDHFNGANGGNNNRFYLVANVPSTNVLSVFNDASLSDYFTQSTPVYFSVDMNGAVGGNSTQPDFGSGFVDGSDSVYINGQFSGWYAWSGGVTPVPAPAGYQLFEKNPPSAIFTNTIVIPGGTPLAFNYKYGIDFGSANGGPNDNEAGSGINHYRVVRNLKLNPHGNGYELAQDKFGNMYGEPFFNSGNTAGGNLSAGKPVAGKIPVTWLGRPGARLQVNSALSGGTWQTLVATDGTNWVSGSYSTNGFVSQTNWPATDKAFFRLVK